MNIVAVNESSIMDAVRLDQYIILTRAEGEWANGTTWAGYAFAAWRALAFLQDRLQPGENPATPEELVAMVSVNEPGCIEHLLEQMDYYYVTRSAFDGQIGTRRWATQRLTESHGQRVIRGVREPVVAKLVQAAQARFQEATAGSDPLGRAQQVIDALPPAQSHGTNAAERFEAARRISGIV